MEVRVDLSGLQRTAEASVKRMSAAAARGINDLAFELRKETPDYLNRVIDRPTPFSIRPPQVDKASPATMTGTIRIGREQASYLRYSEHGQTDEKLIVPIAENGGADRHGNLLKRLRAERLGKTTERKARKVIISQVKRGKNKGKIRRRTRRMGYSAYFVGLPANRPGAKAGIYLRNGNNSELDMVAEFRRSHTYSPSFGIRAFWSTAARKRLHGAIMKRLSARP